MRGVVLEGDVEVLLMEVDDDEVCSQITIYTDTEDITDLADVIEAEFGYGQENNPRGYGPLRITIERV